MYECIERVTSQSELLGAVVVTYVEFVESAVQMCIYMMYMATDKAMNVSVFFLLLLTCLYIDHFMIKSLHLLHTMA